MVFCTDASDPLVKVIVEVPAAIGLSVTALPFASAPTAAGLLDATLNVSAPPAAVSAVTVTTRLGPPASAVQLVPDGSRVSCASPVGGQVALPLAP